MSNVVAFFIGGLVAYVLHDAIKVLAAKVVELVGKLGK